MPRTMPPSTRPTWPPIRSRDDAPPPARPRGGPGRQRALGGCRAPRGRHLVPRGAGPVRNLSPAGHVEPPMIQNLTPYDILATGTVVRWHTLRTARQQTLADHKARVALLAVWLGHR